MSAENEEPKKPAEPESTADSAEEAEVIRTPIVPESIMDASGSLTILGLLVKIEMRSHRNSQLRRVRSLED
jgi:hypothetical protein